MSDNRPVIESPSAKLARVVDLAGYRIARGCTELPPACDHADIVIDEGERRVFCRDCNTTVDPFTILVEMANRWSDMIVDIEGRQKVAQQLVDEAKNLRTATFRRRIAKELDQTWSTNGGCPCPHCDTVLLADDFKGKTSWHNGQIEMERRLTENRHRREVEILTAYSYDDLRAKLSAMSIEEAAADLRVSVALIEEYRGRLGVFDRRPGA